MSSFVYGLHPISLNETTNIYELIYVSGKIFIQSTIPSHWGIKETRIITVEDIPS